MKRKICMSVISIVLCIAIATPMLTVYADSSGKVGEPAVFHATGSGDSTTGDSDTNTNINTGGSDASTDSTADKQNKESNIALQHYIETIKGQVVDTSGITDGSNYIWVESMLVPVDLVRDFLDQAKYNSDGKYGSVTTSDKNRTNMDLTEEQRLIMHQVIHNQIGVESLENGGTKVSNSNMANMDFSNVNLPDTWPVMEPDMDTEQLREFIEYLIEHGYTIPGTGEENWIDFEQKVDRYRYVEEYLNAASITDTVNIQHIIEYSVSSVTEKTLYREQQIEYPGGGYYHWDIQCIDAENPDAIGQKISVRTPTGVLVTQFGTPGVYDITARENIVKTFVSTVSYDIREYWILADTGQVIYKKLSNGKTGALDSVAGRNNDNNTVYYNLSTEYNYGSGDETAISGEIIYDTRHTVTADMLEGVFPATGVYSNVYNTVRIQ